MHHQTLIKSHYHHTSNGCMTSLTDHTSHGPLLLIEQISPHDQILNNDVLLLFSRCTLLRNCGSRCCTTFLIHWGAHDLCRCLCFLSFCPFVLLFQAKSFFSLEVLIGEFGWKKSASSRRWTGRKRTVIRLGVCTMTFFVVIGYQSMELHYGWWEESDTFFTVSLATLSPQSRGRIWCSTRLVHVILVLRRFLITGQWLRHFSHNRVLWHPCEASGWNNWTQSFVIHLSPKTTRKKPEAPPVQRTSQQSLTSSKQQSSSDQSSNRLFNPCATTTTVDNIPLGRNSSSNIIPYPRHSRDIETITQKACLDSTDKNLHKATNKTTKEISPPQTFPKAQSSKATPNQPTNHPRERKSKQIYFQLVSQQ